MVSERIWRTPILVCPIIQWSAAISVGKHRGETNENNADSMTLKFAGFLPVELYDHMMIEQI